MGNHFRKPVDGTAPQQGAAPAPAPRHQAPAAPEDESRLFPQPAVPAGQSEPDPFAYTPSPDLFDGVAAQPAPVAAPQAPSVPDPAAPAAPLSSLPSPVKV